MKNIKLLSTTLLFSSLLAGCGMSGPLYRVAEPASPQVEQAKAEETENNDETTLENSQANLESSEEAEADEQNQ